MKVDAIVNTTNKDISDCGGADHASEGCRYIVSAKITKGCHSDAKYIIHTSAPIWQDGLSGESRILKSCYIESLKLAVENGCESVAFPLISAGAYGCPKDKVLKFAIGVIAEFLLEYELTVYLCVSDRNSYEFSKELFDEISGFIDDGCAAVHKSVLKFPLRFNALASAHSSEAFAQDAADSECESQAEEVIPPPETMSVCACAPAPKKSARNKSLEEYMKAMDKSFAYKLFDYIDSKGMTDVECYKKANIDKKTFSKIKCNPDTYKPSKQTAVAFAIALELTLDETQDLLSSAGLTLSRSFVFDKIIRYFIQKGEYDVFVINEALFEFDQVLLGC